MRARVHLAGIYIVVVVAEQAIRASIASRIAPSNFRQRQRAARLRENNGGGVGVCATCGRRRRHVRRVTR